MTNAVNLAALAPNVNSTGQTSLTAGVTGTLPAANGGTGLTAPGTSGNLLTSNGTAWVSSAPSGGVSSVNGATGAVVTTGLYDIGMTVLGRPQNITDYAVGSTLAGSSLYTTPSTLMYWFPAAGGWYGAGFPTLSGTLINTGSWRCVTRCYADANYGYPGLWVRYA